MSRDTELQHYREETPGLSHLVHLNAAGAALSPTTVNKAVSEHLEEESIHGGYDAVSRNADQVQRPYLALAKLLNCSKDEIAVVVSATFAWQQVFYGIQFKSGERILTSVAEYGSNYIAFLQVCKRTGAVVDVIPETEEGDIDITALEELLSRPVVTRLIAITHVPTSSGRVYDAAAVGAIAKKHQVPCLLDACQSVGQMPVDVQQLQCDFLSGTSRKYLRGPRGAGFLYVAKHAMNFFEPATLDMTGAEWSDMNGYTMAPTAKRYEQYEMNVAAKVGLGVAVEYCLDVGMEWVWERIQALASELRELLLGVRGVHVHDKGRLLCGIVSFTVEGLSGPEVKTYLLSNGISVHVSWKPSTRIDFERRGLQEVVRASVHYYNTSNELQQLADALHKLSIQNET